jgi:Flp pilus assembly protein TadG
MKNQQISRRLRAFLADQGGAIGIVIALMIPVLFGFAGLAVDMGHSYSVQSQLKNASDAGALRGARTLVPYTGSPATPNWASALAQAPLAVNLNRADGKQLTDSDVTYGYWNFATSSLDPAGTIPTANHYPAVRVAVSKSGGKNGGPVSMYLASVLGVLPANVSSSSVAITSFPTGMPPGGLKPMVATTDIIAKYWDWPTGSPVQFKLGEPDKKDTVNDTMWSTFKVDDNSNAYTKELILNGNPTDIYKGDYVWLQPGVRAVDYGPMEMGKFINQTVVLPVVSPADLTAKEFAPIQDFIAFHITGYSQGGQYVEGYFDKNYVITNPQKGTGTPTNPYSTPGAPQLVN